MIVTFLGQLDFAHDTMDFGRYFHGSTQVVLVLISVTSQDVPEFHDLPYLLADMTLLHSMRGVADPILMDQKN